VGAFYHPEVAHTGRVVMSAQLDRCENKKIGGRTAAQLALAIQPFNVDYSCWL